MSEQRSMDGTAKLKPNKDGLEHLLTIGLFVTGFLLHCLLAFRSWIGGDQIHLLNLGLDLSVSGTIHPFAKMMAGAGGNPGALLQFLIGIPLSIVPHYHSPMVLVLLAHAGAGWLLASVFRKDFGERIAAVFMLVYWLSPWRLYNGGFLWEPSYVFLPAALHLWSCWKLKDVPATGPSMVLGLTLLISLQIHNSAFVLFLGVLILLVRKTVRIHWKGFMLGAVIGSLTLIPTLIFLAVGTMAGARESQGFLGESLLNVYPVFKGFLYWFTLGGLDVVRPLNETVFLEQSPGGTWVRILQALCVLSVGISIFSSWWFFRPLWRKEGNLDPRLDWWRTYAIAMMLSLVIAAALSPIVLQGWQVVVALHAATIPVILWIGLRWFRDTTPRRLGLAGYALLQIAIAITLGFGHPIYRIPDTLPHDMKTENENLLNIIPLER